MRCLSPAPSVTWVTDRRCTLVVHEDCNAVFQLAGLSEVLWDCLMQGFPYAKIIRVIAEMRGGALDPAEEWVESALREWQDLRLVVVQEEEEYG